ncbi:hypothetical protein Athai_51540 [Actinocatenispora thailandica]|uniref:Uncharacterized protein n=1 Tax=Actinocatenispora thailandica TaxID=227318 RepID=A0A7R7DTV4_9ACTN|nr:hypothetical protein [Actinocatenispora thailandica]BCJ37651.1 hypothetical protein Athai_51540 [Actinocatenispora thailandica]
MLRHRWTPVVLVALALFVINVIGRVVVYAAGIDGDKQMFMASLYSMLAMALVAGYAGFRWTRRYEMVRVVGEVGFAIILGSLLTTMVSPLFVGLDPFSGGASIYLRQLGVCFVICAVGALVGSLIVLAMGQDRTGRAWKYQEQRLRAKPRRTAKR